MIAVAVVIVLGAGAVAFARPHAISEPVLGTEWQCSRAAFVVTCHHRWARTWSDATSMLASARSWRRGGDRRSVIAPPLREGNANA